MPELITTIPRRRRELLIRPLGDQGRFTVKDLHSGRFFHLGAQEQFLLECLDGEQQTAAICAAYESRFGEPLTADDLQGFLELARRQGFLESAGAEQPTAGGEWADSAARPAGVEQPAPPARARPRRQSIVYWRTSLFDPDRLFNWLGPKLGFVWTRTFLVLSAAGIVAALAVVCANGQHLTSGLRDVFRWEVLVLAWLTLLAVTTCHEFAHGLTCKRYGGEVHEIGFLLMYFMPCLYCNVSDAWLFREKSKRLWVTFAGGYCDLCLWALAVFVWRLTIPESLLHYLAWVVLAICGGRAFLNFNPLIKLDGYYLLSDLLEIPNLRRRSWNYFQGYCRWLLWGTDRPARAPKGKLLLLFGGISWVFSFFFLSLMLVGFSRALGARWGPIGIAGAAALGMVSLPGLFRGFGNRETNIMSRVRYLRTILWVLGPGIILPALFLVQVEDRSSGPFQVRPSSRVELRAEVAGFLEAVHFEEGDHVSTGAVVARLRVPDLASRSAQKLAEVRESEARLRLLEAGPREEEIVEQRRRVERMKTWRDLAAKDLAHARQALQEELERLDKQIVQQRAELDAAASSNRAD